MWRQSSHLQRRPCRPAGCAMISSQVCGLLKANVGAHMHAFISCFHIIRTFRFISSGLLSVAWLASVPGSTINVSTPAPSDSSFLELGLLEPKAMTKYWHSAQYNQTVRNKTCGMSKRPMWANFNLWSTPKTMLSQPACGVASGLTVVLKLRRRLGSLSITEVRWRSVCRG